MADDECGLVVDAGARSQRGLPGPDWPFTRLLDAGGRAIGWSLLHAPVATTAQHARFADLRRAGERFVGMSSHLEFPSGCEDGPLDYQEACEAWCHCFRAPDAYLRSDLPRLLLSLSDFCDPQHVAQASPAPMSVNYDVVYVGASERWKQDAKGWSLAASCVPRLVRAFDWRALVVGTPCAIFPQSPGITFRPSLPWSELLGYIAGARVLLAPNEMDPSPRVLAEALCLDVPIAVNRRILGGWKYVNRFTGTFFDDENDLVDAVASLGAVSPRVWFRANHGPFHAGRRLLALIRSLDPEVEERSHLAIEGA
ncbi:hypothetical protein J2X04_001702 [Lysobacter niabensis]|uniref:Glycosyltransferase n=1 Tax=Agrilutibacter niabensis TaxID=380628 RepID=A0ABU1VPE3_9GAMM|nr:glycosyltransferase [Lysobacter niabensis]MDR7099355.1 hypothetical protein [Lysobacter niabensis]